MASGRQYSGLKAGGDTTTLYTVPAGKIASVNVSVSSVNGYDETAALCLEDTGLSGTLYSTAAANPYTSIFSAKVAKQANYVTSGIWITRDAKNITFDNGNTWKATTGHFLVVNQAGNFHAIFDYSGNNYYRWDTSTGERYGSFVSISVFSSSIGTGIMWDGSRYSFRDTFRRSYWVQDAMTGTSGSTAATSVLTSSQSMTGTVIGSGISGGDGFYFMTFSSGTFRDYGLTNGYSDTIWSEDSTTGVTSGTSLRGYATVPAGTVVLTDLGEIAFASDVKSYSQNWTLMSTQDLTGLDVVSLWYDGIANKYRYSTSDYRVFESESLSDQFTEVTDTFSPAGGEGIGVSQKGIGLSYIETMMAYSYKGVTEYVWEGDDLYLETNLATVSSNAGVTDYLPAAAHHEVTGRLMNAGEALRVLTPTSAFVNISAIEEDV